MKVSIKAVMVRGERRYKVSWTPPGGRRQRRFLRTRKLAETEQQTILDQFSRAGAVWVSLTGPQRDELLSVWSEVKLAGLSLRGVWDAYRRSDHVNGRREACTLHKAIKELLDDKKAMNCRPRYIKSLRNCLTAFARGREQTPVHDISSQDIEEWFQGRSEAITTRKANTGRISALFGYCVRRRYVLENPCDRVVSPRSDVVPPKILTPTQIARVLSTTLHKHPDLLAWVTCCLLAGLRPEETVCPSWEGKGLKVGWQHVDLTRGTITVPHTATKVRRGRIVHLEPNAVAWMKLSKELGAKLPITEIIKQLFLRELRKCIHAKKWPHDIMRHTAASVLMAKYQDAGRVADELGNSAGILLRHYRELMHQDVAEKILAITPERLSSVRQLRLRRAPRRK